MVKSNHATTLVTRSLAAALAIRGRNSLTLLPDFANTVGWSLPNPIIRRLRILIKGADGRADSAEEEFANDFSTTWQVWALGKFGAMFEGFARHRWHRYQIDVRRSNRHAFFDVNNFR